MDQVLPELWIAATVLIGLAFIWSMFSFHHNIMICAVGGTSFFQSLAIGKIDIADLLYN